MTNDAPQPTQQSPAKQAQQPVSTPAKTAVPAKSFEDWQNDALTRILQVSLTVCIHALKDHPLQNR